MQTYNMKLNSAKCTFGVSARKFLEFMVTQRGIEVNSDQIRVVLKIPALSIKKGLQRLMGCLAALGRFIAHFTDKLKSFFLMLREANMFGWTDECKQAFEKCLIVRSVLFYFGTYGTKSKTRLLRDQIEDEKHAHKVRIQATRFTIIDDSLYKRSFGGPYLRCLSDSKVKYIITELYKCVCDNHPGGRTLVHHAHTQGYYWPTMKLDAEIRDVTGVRGTLPSPVCLLKFSIRSQVLGRLHNGVNIVNPLPIVAV
ncbi:hypothetical protein CK203_086157 [Vitis vinifera]|uniref:Integrase zinc-binding domain-containing protein n=1 Tax=Vitis vinifera TaxID=29760 RepID=A0A438CTB3_VITVI|nr:hypothetical protein CK203_086157 [Vitis vinifera]